MTMHESFTVVIMQFKWEWFGKDVSYIVFCVDPFEFDIVILLFLMNVVDSQNKMSSKIRNVISVGQNGCSLIVSVYDCGLCLRIAEFVKETSEPSGFSNCQIKCFNFSFSA